MPSNRPIAFQPSLFAAAEPAFDEGYASLQRIELAPAAWVDWAPDWVQGSDALFEQIVRSKDWKQRRRRIFDQDVLEPRLTAGWSLESEKPLEPPVVEAMRRSLSRRYGVVLDSAGFNLYRDGGDGVAWHRDRIRRDIAQPVVALVCLGERRRLLLRPRGGGPSRAFPLGRGDLFVTGGTTQRTWEHAILKVKSAGPRISIAFRHGLDAAYAVD